jgi:exopolyphosphatase/guanosine-5'-triphosphate,3'-diphosphate pyrophosphatase
MNGHSTGRVGSHLAAIDVGTNSFHLVVARITEGGFAMIDRRKETIRLGHGLVDTGNLTLDAIDRGIAALVRMRRVADAHDAAIRAVATSAVRDARNAAAFLDRARTEAGVLVDVISGLDEARLIHLGVLEAIPVLDRRLLVIDIGGGSTEVLVGQAGETLAAESFNVGAVRLTDRYFPDGAIETGAVAACRSHIESTIAAFWPEVRRLGFDLAIASSGTAQTVATMAAARREADRRAAFNGFEFSTADIDAVVDELLGHATVESRRSVLGLEPRRADIIVAGALVLQAVAHAFGVATFTFSTGALREGILADTLARLRSGSTDGLSR